LAVKPPSADVLIDGSKWDGSRLGDVAFVMTPNRNIVRQQQRVARACTAAGLEVCFVYVDIGPTWNPSLEDYSLAGTHIVQLPLKARLRGLPFPNPLVLLYMFAELKGILPGISFGALVTHLDDYGFGKLMCYWARRSAIPSIVLQEGMMLAFGPGDVPGEEVKGRLSLGSAASRLVHHIPHDLFLYRKPYIYADYFCAYGDVGRREMERHGRLPETIFVVGNPSFDHVMRPESPPAVRNKSRTIMYIEQYIAEEKKELEFLEHLSMACCEEADDELIIKLHPSSTLKRIELVKALFHLENWSRAVHVIDSGDAVDMLDGVDLVLLINSTVAYHAMVKGIPVITVNYLAKGFGEFDASRYGGALDVRTPQDLRKALCDALTNEVVRERLHRGANRVIDDHLFKLDGSASTRIAQVIVNVVQRNRGAALVHE
jgi:hypothetical protein